jgi:hypothetical protein
LSNSDVDPNTATGPDDVSGEDPEALRREVVELRQKLAEAEAANATSATKRATKHRVRSTFAVILIVLGSVLAPIAGISIFLRNQVLNTDRYVSNVAPLSKDPAIASVMATEVTNQLFKHVDLQSQIAGVLPPKGTFLAEPLTNVIKSETYNVTYKIILSDRFNETWLAMNRAVHKSLVGVLTGSHGGAVSADKNGKVTLDLHSLAVQVVHQMDERGIRIFDKLPISKINLQIVLLQSAGLVKAQQATQALNHLALFLPALCLLCLLGAIFLAPWHRRAVMWSGLGLAASMGVLAIILGLLRSYLISASAGHELTPAAATALFDTLLRYVRTGLRITFVVGALVALVAWLVGPARPAVWLRHAVVRAYRWIERSVREKSWNLGPVGEWVASNKGPVEGVLAGLAVLLLVLLTPGIGGALLILVVAGLLILLVHWFKVGPKVVATAPAAEPQSAAQKRPVRRARDHAQPK